MKPLQQTIVFATILLVTLVQLPAHADTMGLINSLTSVERQRTIELRRHPVLRVVVTDNETWACNDATLFGEVSGWLRSSIERRA